MIIRVVAIDPKPRAGRSDVLCYQVPENSREHEFLIEMLTLRGVENEIISIPRKPKATT